MKSSMKPRHHYLIALLIAIAINVFNLGEAAMESQYIYDLHENAHIEAYTEEGINAYRLNNNSVYSDRYTINGLLAGYQAEISFLTYTTMWSSFLLIIFMLYFNAFYLTGLVALPLSAWSYLVVHMYGPAGDIDIIIEQFNIYEYPYQVIERFIIEDLRFLFFITIAAVIFVGILAPQKKTSQPTGQSEPQTQDAPSTTVHHSEPQTLSLHDQTPHQAHHR